MGALARGAKRAGPLAWVVLGACGVALGQLRWARAEGVRAG